MTLLRAGAEVRVMGDPMQAIYASGSVTYEAERWAALRADACEVVELTTPHRWSGGSEPLGEWTIQAREALAAGHRIDVRRPPPGLTLIRADYHAPRHDSIILERRDARAVWKYLDASGDGLLVLNPHNRAVESIRAYFKRRLVIWEGHTRDALDRLAVAIKSARGDVEPVCEAFLRFARATCTGITKADCERINREVREGCKKTARGKRPPALQRIATELVTDPSHVGVAGALEVLRSDPSLGDVKIDYPVEYRDAIRLGGFADAAEALGELHRRRSHSGGMLPLNAVSTIHKAKGLEFRRVMLLPVDTTYFPDTEKSRRLLYVGLSRAVESLVMVVPRSDPSELLLL
jgi:DNA helicase-2/ATP-dependent DNA helicase PcrA